MPPSSEQHLSYFNVSDTMSRMSDVKWLEPSIETVTVMHYHLETCRIRSLAALGLALTTSVVAMVATLVSAL